MGEEKPGNREKKGVFVVNQDTELDAFKQEIDMRQFAVSFGYAMDRRESWRGSTVLRRGADKIVVKRNGTRFPQASDSRWLAPGWETAA